MRTVQMDSKVIHMNGNNIRTDVTSALAHVVSEAIAASGMSKSEVSERTGIPRATLIRRLNGHTPLNIAEITSLAALVGEAPSALIASAEGIST